MSGGPVVDDGWLRIYGGGGGGSATGEGLPSLAQVNRFPEPLRAKSSVWPPTSPAGPGRPIRGSSGMCEPVVDRTGTGCRSGPTGSTERGPARSSSTWPTRITTHAGLLAACRVQGVAVEVRTLVVLTCAVTFFLTAGTLPG